MNVAVACGDESRPSPPSATTTAVTRIEPAPGNGLLRTLAFVGYQTGERVATGETVTLDVSLLAYSYFCQYEAGADPTAPLPDPAHCSLITATPGKADTTSIALTSDGGDCELARDTSTALYATARWKAVSRRAGTAKLTAIARLADGREVEDGLEIVFADPDAIEVSTYHQGDTGAVHPNLAGAGHTWCLRAMAASDPLLADPKGFAVTVAGPDPSLEPDRTVQGRTRGDPYLTDLPVCVDFATRTAGDYQFVASITGVSRTVPLRVAALGDVAAVELRALGKSTTPRDVMADLLEGSTAFASLALGLTSEPPLYAAAARLKDGSLALGGFGGISAGPLGVIQVGEQWCPSASARIACSLVSLTPVGVGDGSISIAVGSATLRIPVEVRSP
jgi:hypothetical protein